MFFYIALASLFVYMYPYNVKKEVAHTLLKWMKYEVSTSPLSQSVIVVSSHTSIYDLLLGLCIYYAQYSHLILYISVKKEFEFYLTPFLWMDSNVKSIVLDASQKNQTDVLLKRVEHHSVPFLLFMAPEGTEHCTDKIHKGFWYLSKHLHIPIAYLGMDYYLRKIQLEPPSPASAQWTEEEKQFIQNCQKYIPLYPECCYWTKDFYTMHQN